MVISRNCMHLISRGMRSLLPVLSVLAVLLWSAGRSGAASPIVELLNPPAGTTSINVLLLFPRVYTINGRALNTKQVNLQITKSGEVDPDVDTNLDVAAGAWRYDWAYPDTGGTFTISAAPTASGGTPVSITIELLVPGSPNPQGCADLMLNAGNVYANATAINVQLRIASSSVAVKTIAWDGDITGVGATPISVTNYNDNNSGSGLLYLCETAGSGTKTVTASVEFNTDPAETVGARRAIIVDIVKPTATSQDATVNDFVTPPDDGDVSVVNLSGTVTDADGPRAVLIELFEEDAPAAQPLTPATIAYGDTFGGTLDWTARVTVPNSSTAAHTFLVRAIDYAGNVGESSVYSISQYTGLALIKPFIVGRDISDSPVPVYVNGNKTIRSQVVNHDQYHSNSAKLYVDGSHSDADMISDAGVYYLTKDKDFSGAGEKSLYFFAKESGTHREVTSEILHIFIGPIGVSNLSVTNIVTKESVKYVAGTAHVQVSCSTAYFQNYVKTLNLNIDGVPTSIKDDVTYDGVTMNYDWDTTGVAPGSHSLRITGTDLDDNSITQSNLYTVYVANASLALADIVVTGDVSSSTPPRVKGTVTVTSRVTEAGGHDELIPLVINNKQLLGTETSPATPEATLTHVGPVYTLTYNWDTTNATDGVTYNLQYRIIDIFGATTLSNSSAVIVDNTSTNLTITKDDIAGLNPASGMYKDYPGDLNSIYVKGQIRIPGVCTNYDMIKLETIDTVEDRYIYFNTDPAVTSTDYTLTKIVAANTADITVDWDTVLETDGEYEIWLSATDINDLAVPCNHEILTVDNTVPDININDPSGATPQIKFNPSDGENQLPVKAMIDETNPLDWTVDIAYYLTGDTELKHDIYTWSERSKDSLPGRTNSPHILLTTTEASVGNVSVVWTIPDDWDTATSGTILVSAIDKAHNEAPLPPATPQRTFSFALPGDTTVAPIAALAVHLPDDAEPSARFVISKNNGEPATYETIGNPQTSGMAASSGDPTEDFIRPNAFYPNTDYDNSLTPTLVYNPKRVYTNTSFVVDASSRISPTDTPALMLAYKDTYSLTVAARVYDAGQGDVKQSIVEFILKGLAVSIWDQSITRTLDSIQIGGAECPTLYTLTNVANKEYYGSNQATLEVLVDKTNPTFQVMSPSSLYRAAAYTDASHTTNTPMATTQRYIVVPPGGTLPVVLKLNKNAPDDFLRTPLKRIEITNGGTTVYKQLPVLQLTLNDGRTGNPVSYGGTNVVYNLIRAAENPNPYNGDGRAMVTGNNFDQDGYTVAWNIPIDKKYAVGRIYRLRLQGMSDIVGNIAMTNASSRTVDAVDIYFKVSLSR